MRQRGENLEYDRLRDEVADTKATLRAARLRITELETALREIARFCNVEPAGNSSAWSVYMMVPAELRGSPADTEGGK